MGGGSGRGSGRVRLFVGNRGSGRVNISPGLLVSGPRKVTRGQLCSYLHLNCSKSIQVVTSKAFTASHKLIHYWSSKWNKFDVIVAVFFIISILLRWTLPDDSSFEWARMFYAGTLAFYFLRFLQIFYVFEHIGPLVIIIQYMASFQITFNNLCHHRNHINNIDLLV